MFLLIFEATDVFVESEDDEVAESNSLYHECCRYNIVLSSFPYALLTKVVQYVEVAKLVEIAELVGSQLFYFLRTSLLIKSAPPADQVVKNIEFDASNSVGTGRQPRVPTSAFSIVNIRISSLESFVSWSRHSNNETVVLDRKEEL